MKYSLLILATVISLSESTGSLNFHLTSDQDCLLHLSSNQLQLTIRLFAFQTKSIDIPCSSNQLSIDFHFLHHFTGKLLHSTHQEFHLDNDGRVESRIIDQSIILSIQSIFNCDPGFFGPFCDRKSRITVATTTVIPGPTGLSKELIVYSSLSLLIILLIIANAILIVYRPAQRKYMEEEEPIEMPRILQISMNSGFSKDETICSTV